MCVCDSRELVPGRDVGGGDECDGGQAQVTGVGEHAHRCQVGLAAVVDEPRRAAVLCRVYAELHFLAALLEGKIQIQINLFKKFGKI